MRFRWHRHHRSGIRFAPLLFHPYPQEDIEVTTAVLTITDSDTEPITAALGSELDAAGNPVTDDPIVSASWSVDNPAVLSGSTSADGLTATFTPTGQTGVCNITATCTTQSGATVVATGTVTVGAGPVTSVAMTLTQAPEASADPSATASASDSSSTTPSGSPSESPAAPTSDAWSSTTPTDTAGSDTPS